MRAFRLDLTICTLCLPLLMAVSPYGRAYAQQSGAPPATDVARARVPDAPLLADVRLRGLSSSQAANVRAQVGLFQLDASELAQLRRGRLALLLRRAPDEVRRALEPFGYYTVGVDVQVEDSPQGARVLLDIERGPPVRVRALEVSVEGDAQNDPEVQASLQVFRPRIGDLLNHPRYEGGKAAVARALATRGYFDASVEQARVEVTRADSRAEIDLRWRSGARYVFGPASISGSQLQEGLVERWIDIEPGEPFDQDRLLRLHQRLTDLDYFGFIDVRPEPEAETLSVPVAIEVTAAKRSVYTAGVSFGTDSGAGLKLGLDRRWVNPRGHKFSSELDIAQRRSRLGAFYRIPAFTPIDGWYQLGLSYRDEESDSVLSETLELAATRSGRIGDWTLNAGLHLLRERYTIGGERSLDSSGISTLVYPAASARYRRYNDPNYSTRGFVFGAELKLGAQAIGSDSNFAQLLLDSRWIRGFGERNRVLLRGQLGRTFSDEFLRLPSSLRFFAGGDRSVRGYGYQEISPLGREGQPIGGRNLAVLNLEYERMFTDTWGAAVFADAGNAFNDISEGLRKGVGLGLRWRSPVGQVAVDIARGLDEPRDPWQLHISLGPEL